MKYNDAMKNRTKCKTLKKRKTIYLTADLFGLILAASQVQKRSFTAQVEFILEWWIAQGFGNNK